MISYCVCLLLVYQCIDYYDRLLHLDPPTIIITNLNAYACDMLPGTVSTLGTVMFLIYCCPNNTSVGGGMSSILSHLCIVRKLGEGTWLEATFRPLIIYI